MQMKDLVFISACPDDLCFSWQVQIYLHNFRKFGYSEKAQVLIFLPFSRLRQGFHPVWATIEKQFPETSFYYFTDEENIEKTFIQGFNYTPIIRPYILKKHFKMFPSLEKKAIFYHDSDIVFTKYTDFSSYLEDEINYISYTGNPERTDNYLDYTYFTKKEEKVKPQYKDLYIKSQPLETFLGLFSIAPLEFKRYSEEQRIGGAQYLLKNINSRFWADVLDGCLLVKIFLSNTNQRFMVGNTPKEREDNGFQSFCADMWSLLFNLWKRGDTTECPSLLDFAWSTDKIEKWDKVNIYHDAGINPKVKLFNKRDLPFINNILTCFQKDLSFVDKNYASYKYVQEIEETRQYLLTTKNKIKQ